MLMKSDELWVTDLYEMLLQQGVSGLDLFHDNQEHKGLRQLCHSMRFRISAIVLLVHIMMFFDSLMRLSEGPSRTKIDIPLRAHADNGRRRGSNENDTLLS